jgi:FecR protein
MNDSQPPYDGQRLRQLVAELCNCDISPERQNELGEMLASSELARTEYWELMDVHSGLYWALADNESFDEELTTLLIDVATNVPREPGTAHRQTVGRWRAAGWVISACLLIGATIFAIGSFVRDDRVADQLSVQEMQVEQRAALGHLRALRPDTKWSLGKPGIDDDDQVFSGDTLWLDRGAAELHLANNTVAKLEAPLILQAVSLSRVRILQGRITVDVAKGAEGFTVETASAEVIDLGTTFSVEVGDGNTDVVVFQGSVDLRVPDSVHSDMLASNVPTKRIRTGEAVRVSGDRTLSRIVNVQQTDFSQNEVEDGTPNRAVISAVADNINRDDLWSFYEIVPGGMREDARAFVDRRHEWNGIDGTGLPSYLVDGDYVKTFNDDKAAADLHVDVTLSQPAVLYILLDKRVVPPSWLTDSFEDTGDEVGVDEAWHDPNNFKPGLEDFAGVGAGKSIERQHSVWKRVVETGGAVTLGPNGQLPDKTKWRGTRAGANMYGIVAVPFDDANGRASAN